MSGCSHKHLNKSVPSVTTLSLEAMRKSKMIQKYKIFKPLITLRTDLMSTSPAKVIVFVFATISDTILKNSS